MMCVNLGCGTRYHPEWLNFDLVPHSSAVRRFDITRPLPLANDSCDVVYHAAVLEHLRTTDADRFLADCLRVLKPGGVIRVGVPDLERICRLYLSKLELAADGDAAAAADHDWLMLELFDQMVRERSGGEMLAWLARDPIPNERFVLDRIGGEGEELIAAIRANAARLERFPFRFAVRIVGAFRTIKGVIMAPFGGRRAMAIGRFRLGGEVHQWMYDRFSLARLLRAAGFAEPRVRAANESRIAEWNRWRLDVLPDGRPVKPDLFFMEAVKPQ